MIRNPVSTLVSLGLTWAAIFSSPAPAQVVSAEKRDLRAVREMVSRFEGGRKWGVVIGVNEYLDPEIPKLSYCVADARLVARTLAEKCGYSLQDILLLADDQEKAHLRPVRMNVLKQVPEWLKRAKKGDTVLVFFAGHGFLDSEGQSYLAPQDCERASLGLYALRTNELRNWLHQCAATQKILVLDCCHSGSIRGGADSSPSSEELSEGFKKAEGLVVLASCKKNERSADWKEKGHGLFTHFLVEGLKGEADFDHNGLIDNLELYRYVHEKVSMTAQRELNVRQNPVQIIGEDTTGLFALARISGISGMDRVTAAFAVRRENEDGPVAQGIDVELRYRGRPGDEHVVLGRGTSAADGKVAIALELTATQRTQGLYEVALSHDGQVNTWPLPGFPRNTSWSLYVPHSGRMTNGIGMKLVLIPSGEFLMGNSESPQELFAAYQQYDAKLTLDRFTDGYPQHRVRISKPFYLGACVVTVGQFRKFVEDAHYKTDAEKDGVGGRGWTGENGPDGLLAWVQNPQYTWRNTGFEQTDEHPVVNVTWNDAQAFLKWLGAKEGKEYRLPTEAEWEYACRAGTTTRYYNSDDPEKLAEVGNVADASMKAKFPQWDCIKGNDGYVFTAPVGQFKPNKFGLYDMHGNVFEWCQDVYDAGYYHTRPAVDVDPTGPPSPSSTASRAVRGGCWFKRPYFMRSAARASNTPDDRNFQIGFRAATTP